MESDRAIYNGYGKSPKNEDGKAIRHVIEETNTHFTLKIPAFTKKGKVFVGWGQATVPKVNSSGLKVFKANLTQLHLKDNNRQVFTDVRNNVAKAYEIKAIEDKVARGEGTLEEKIKVLKAKAKSNPEAAKAIESVLSTLLKA